MKYGEVDLGQIEAMLNKIGGINGMRRLLADETVITDKVAKVSVNGLANGGITYATGLDTEKFLADWTEFYKVHYGREINLSTVPLPPITVGFGWGVVVLPNLTVQQVFDKSKELFPSGA